MLPDLLPLSITVHGRTITVGYLQPDTVLPTYFDRLVEFPSWAAARKYAVSLSARYNVMWHDVKRNAYYFADGKEVSLRK